MAAALRSEIQDHRLPPGSALPSEAVLQERFGVARSVVRQAMSTLVAEGLVQRGQGRGSVVAPVQEYHRLVASASGLFAQLTAVGLDVRTEVLHVAPQPPPSAAAELGPGPVLRLERLRSVAGEPLAYIRTYLPLPRCADLDPEVLRDASLHAVLKQRLGVQPVAGRRQVRAVGAAVDLAGLLRVRTGEPLLLLEGSTQDEHGAPLEVFATWHRADRVAFDVEAEKVDAAPGGTVSPDRLQEAAEAAGRLAVQLRALARG